MSKYKILIIDDERNTREGLEKILQIDYHITLAEDALIAIELIKHNKFDIVLTDLRMPGISGMDFIAKTSKIPNAPIIIMLTAYGSVEIAIKAMKAGAYDFLTKPINLDNLEMVIKRGLDARQLAIENDHLKNELGIKKGFENLIGNSKGIKKIINEINHVATAKTTVLITGESGTGKELVARAIHDTGPRSKRPFVIVHCAALSTNLIESELFGHEKGAFTGASERKYGKIEQAHSGTLFLDEIGEIDMPTQIKLLRVLDKQSFERVGGSESINVDVRFVAATNRNLKTEVDNKTFREDLYYRLNVLNIHLPTLRERKEDISLLLNHYLDIFKEQNNKKLLHFSEETINILTEYKWRGNIRELRNVVERMVVMSVANILTINDIPSEIIDSITNETSDKLTEKTNSETKFKTLDKNANEKSIIIKALEEARGNITKASEIVGISRRTMHRKIKLYNINSSKV